MNRIYCILTAAAVLLLAASCSAPALHSELTNVAPYLYEITYYDMDDALFDTSAPFDAVAACSSVRNGAFHGRNLDLFYNESAEVVVHMAAGEGRFASVGVCGGLPHINPESLESGNEEILARLPLLTMDGVNENSVTVNVNVVPAVDHPCPTGTNPGARRLYLGIMPRYILNHAESARHALELLGELDLYGGFGKEFNLHLMISDPDETLIVEFIDNKIVSKSGAREDEGNIMTNLFSTDLPAFTPHADGIERYALLEDNYAQGCTEEGMAALMQSVRYSRAYQPETDPFWYSEAYAIGTTPDGEPFDYNLDTPDEVIMDYMQYYFEAFRRHERKGEFWQTLHTSVYNIDKQSLLLFVQEDYEHPYRFAL